MNGRAKVNGPCENGRVRAKVDGHGSKLTVFRLQVDGTNEFKDQEGQKWTVKEFSRVKVDGQEV